MKKSGCSGLGVTAGQLASAVVEAGDSGDLQWNGGGGKRGEIQDTADGSDVESEGRRN